MKIKLFLIPSLFRWQNTLKVRKNSRAKDPTQFDTLSSTLRNSRRPKVILHKIEKKYETMNY